MTAQAEQATSIGDALAALEAGLDLVSAAVAAGGLDDLGSRELVRTSARLRSVGQRVDVARLCVLPALEAEGMWSVDGSRSFAHWLARAEDVLVGSARRDVRTARTLRDTLPATRAAAFAGDLGPDHLRAMVDVAPTSAARREALATPVTDEDAGADASGAEAAPATGEELLVGLAGRYPAAQFRRVVRRFAHVADPESDERGYAKSREKEFLEVSPTWDGYHVAGFLTLEHGQALRTALDAVSGVPAAADTRTGTQRRAQALADLARIALDHAVVGTGASIRPHLNVTVSFTELQDLIATTGAADAADAEGVRAGGRDDVGRSGPRDGPGVDRARVLDAEPGSPPAFPDHDAPIPRSLLRRLACDSEVTRIVFGPDSRPLDVGRARRTVTGQLRRAVIARDRRCRWPGCDVPPSRCEVHHAVTHWADGGATSADNAALLCWHHHDLVDTRGITMRWDRGGWQLVDRHGGTITTERG